MLFNKWRCTSTNKAHDITQISNESVCIEDNCYGEVNITGINVDIKVAYGYGNDSNGSLHFGKFPGKDKVPGIEDYVYKQNMDDHHIIDVFFLFSGNWAKIGFIDGKDIWLDNTELYQLKRQKDQEMINGLYEKMKMDCERKGEKFYVTTPYVSKITCSKFGPWKVAFINNNLIFDNNVSIIAEIKGNLHVAAAAALIYIFQDCTVNDDFYHYYPYNGE